MPLSGSLGPDVVEIRLPEAASDKVQKVVLDLQ